MPDHFRHRLGRSCEQDIMPAPLTLRSVVQATEEQLSTSVSGETVILHLADGLYYGLDPVGTLIWDALAAPHPVSALVDMVVARYDVARDDCERDVLALLAELAERRLVAIDDVAGG